MTTASRDALLTIGLLVACVLLLVSVEWLAVLPTMATEEAHCCCGAGCSCEPHTCPDACPKCFAECAEQGPEPKLAAPSSLVFPPRSGRWRVLVLDAIDGDTVRFAWILEDSGRINGINAPEVHGGSRAAGEASREYLRKILPPGLATLRSHGRDKYGRALVDFEDSSAGRPISQLMVEAGKAKPWDGTGPRP